MDTLNIQSAAFVFSCLLFTTLFIKLMTRISSSVGLIDRPNGRKVHERSTPLVGGVSLLSALALSAFTSPLIIETVATYIVPVVATLIVFIMSVYDDRFDLSAKIRLGIQIAAAYMVATSGVRVESLFGMFGIYEITDSVQYALTVFILVGSTNAFNLIDGLDGLAGSVGLLITAVLSLISLYLGLYGLFLLGLGLSAGLLAFLRHNVYPAKIFMGDAGSMTLGFLLTSLSIILLQNGAENQNSQLLFVLITGALLVPVIDAIRVFMKRYSKGYSILKADRTHLHHLLLDDKKNHNKVVRRIILLQIGLFLAGLILINVMDVTSLVLFLVLAQILISKVLMINKSLSKWQEHLRFNEKATLTKVLQYFP